MSMQNIYFSDIDGKPAVCFDTGLDPRSFARTKMSQSLIEPGYVVRPDGSKDTWRAGGVSEVDGFMRVWGAPFHGERLDKLLNAVDSEKQEETLQEALQSVVFWIRAKLFLGDVDSTLNPGATFVCCEDGGNSENKKGSVFFTPENLSQRCLLFEGLETNRYSCPDLKGMEAVAFCAAAMLYNVLTKTQPYPDKINIFQDMREGVFLPIDFAAPGLDKELCALINSALLLPVDRKRTTASGTDILTNLLKILMTKESGVVSLSSLFNKLSDNENAKLLKEKRSYSFKQNMVVKTKRFVTRNKPVLTGAAIAAAFIIFLSINMAKSSKERITTAGMSSDTVVRSYYEGFSSMDHALMEACIYGADKSDVNAAANLYVVNKMRQSYDGNSRSAITSAKLWKDNGGELPAPDVFGITDLSVEHIAGKESDGSIVYRADYILWYPNEPISSIRSDELTLSRVRGSWRITEIKRTLKETTESP